MDLWAIRLFFVFLSTYIGFHISSLFLGGDWLKGFIGALLGMFSALILIIIEKSVRSATTRNLSAAVFGLFFGLFMTWIFMKSVQLVPLGPRALFSIQVVMMIIFCYFGMVISMQGKDDFSIVIPYVKFSRQDMREEVILLDTSVIIDGRVADIGRTGFLEGKFVVPRFVLKELHQIADSADTLKRNRGRRGMDMLHKMKSHVEGGVKIADEDFADIKDVDTKLVKLAKIMNAKVLTNDYNLNKVAQLEGVKILNVNELANALKTVVLPGEIMEVKIIKEGKEKSQGVAYLDDGTMVVVDHAKHLIGKTIPATVTSALQTSAGRMIFAKLEQSD